MGHGTRNNGQIKTFWPDDDEKTMYINGPIDIEEIIEKAQKKWPGIQLQEIEIYAENEQTDCLGNGPHDSGDYTNFLVVMCSTDYQERITEPQNSKQRRYSNAD